MRFSTAIIGLAVVAICFAAIEGSVAEAGWSDPTPDPVAEALVRYCAKSGNAPDVDPGLLRYVTAETRRLSALVGHDDKLKTLLAMWYVESRYKQGALGDDGDSYGIAQTRKQYEPRLRKWWDAKGVELGSIDDPTAQVAFGVAEFVQHWHYARRDKNRLWQTVRRYNGSGWMAKRHARRVFKARAAIFGE